MQFLRTLMHLSLSEHNFKNSVKKGSCILNHSLTVISTLSLLCCFIGPKKWSLASGAPSAQQYSPKHHMSEPRDVAVVSLWSCTPSTILYGSLKQPHLEHRQFHNNEGVEMAVHELYGHTSPISTATEFLKLWQDETCASWCLEMRLQNDDNSAGKKSVFNTVQSSCLVFVNYRSLVTECPSHVSIDTIKHHTY